MSQKQHRDLFTTYQVKMWLIECALLQANTLTNKNVNGGIHLRNKLEADSVYTAIRDLMTAFTKRPRDVQS